MPAGVGEDNEGQKDTKSQIERAIRTSIRRGADEEDWGPGAPISRGRPESILNRATPVALERFSALLSGRA